MTPRAAGRRALLRAGLAAGVSLAVRPARACEFYASTLRILHPWARATADGASTAIVCTSFDEVLRDDRLIGVETPVASGAEIVDGGAPRHGAALDLAIPAGRATVLGETGTVLRLTGLTQPLLVARSYPMTLVFAQGGSVNALLNIDYTAFRFN